MTEETRGSAAPSYLTDQLPRFRNLLQRLLLHPDGVCPECGVRHEHERIQQALDLCDHIEACPQELSPQAEQQLEMVLEFVISMASASTPAPGKVH